MADGPGEDLDALIRRVDPDRWLSSRFIGDREKRADVIALYAFDHELRRAVEATTNPIMAEIRLTWWSEALDEIYAGKPVRRHPTAEALATAVERHRLPREVLEAAVDARSHGDARSAEAAIGETAALVLDPDVDRNVVRSLLGDKTAPTRRLSAASFPVVAHVVLRGRGGSELSRRLRLTWAVLTGRL